MRRKKLANIYVFLGAPFALGIPFLLNAYFPKELLIASKFSVWFLVACLISSISSAGKKRIESIDPELKTRKLLPWLLSITILLLLSFMLFIGQGIGLLHQSITHHQISTLQAAQLLAHSLKTLNINDALFPGSLIAILSLSFFIRLRRSETTQPYSQFIPTMPLKAFDYAIKKTSSGYVETATRIFVFLSIMCFVAQLCLGFGINKNIMFSNLIFVALFVLSYTRIIKRPDSFFNRYRPAPLVGFLFVMILSLSMALLVNWGLSRLLAHNPGTQLPGGSNNYLLIKQTIPLSWQLWSWSWWLLAAPLLASIIVRLSLGKTTREMLWAVLGISTLIGGVFYGLSNSELTHIAIHILNNHHATLFQLFPLVGLLYLFRLSRDNHILWLGFIPLDPAKKIRTVSFKTTWIICSAIFGAILMGNLQGALMAQMIVAIGCFVIYLLCIVYRD